MFSGEIGVDGLVEVLVPQLSEALCDIVGPVQDYCGATLVCMLLFAENSLSALSCAVSMFFFIGSGGMLSWRPISFIVITVSRLLLPIGGLYLLTTGV